MPSFKKPLINIHITYKRLIIAVCLSLLMLAGLWYISHSGSVWIVERFESLCNGLDLDKPSVASSSSSSGSPSRQTVTRPASDTDKKKLQAIVKQVLAPSSSSSGNPPTPEVLVEEESATACELLERPPTLTPEESDTASALDRELSNQILPPTAEARDKLYDDVRQELTSNSNIPSEVSRDISDEDARAVVLVVAIEKQAADGIIPPAEAEATRRMLEAKGFAESPKRGILQQLARQIAPIELNKTMNNNRIYTVDPNIIAAFVEAAKANKNTGNRFERQDTLTYSRHRALYS